MTKPPSRSFLDLPRPTARGAPCGRAASLLSRLSFFLPWDPSVSGNDPRITIKRREPFITPRELFLSVLVLGLLAAWTLEFAPLLHAKHSVRNAAVVAASLAAAGSGNADAAGRRWLEDLPGTGPGVLIIRRHAGPNGKGGWVEATAIQNYYPSTPVISALLPRVIRMEAIEARDVEP